jgi:hypothetical protein
MPEVRPLMEREGCAGSSAQAMAALSAATMKLIE